MAGAGEKTREALIATKAMYEVEIALLRNTLIAMGRMIPGVALHDDVSSSFLALLPTELASVLAAPPVEGLTSGEGWVYWNPDAGEEYADSHPVRSGECVDAERIRQSTPQEDVLWRAMQEQFARAEALAVSSPTHAEHLRVAVAEVLNAAWSLCDDTAEGDSDKPEVPREAWKRLSDALDALEPIIPESEQPCRPGVAARLLAASPKATATASVRELLAEVKLSIECAAGCDEGVDPDTASSEVMSFGGSALAVAYDNRWFSWDIATIGQQDGGK